MHLSSPNRSIRAVLPALAPSFRPSRSADRSNLSRQVQQAILAKRRPRNPRFDLLAHSVSSPRTSQALTDLESAQHSISFLETPPKGATKRQRDSHNPPAHLLELRRRASGQGVQGGWGYGGVESSRRVRSLGLHEEMDEPLIDYNEIDRDWTPSRSAPRPPILPIAIRAQRDDRVLARRIIDELRWAVEFVWTLLYAWLAFVTFGMIRR